MGCEEGAHGKRRVWGAHSTGRVYRILWAGRGRTACAKRVYTAGEVMGYDLYTPWAGEEGAWGDEEGEDTGGWTGKERRPSKGMVGSARLACHAGHALSMLIGWAQMADRSSRH